MLYTYVGTVLPDSTRINSPVVDVQLAAGPDHPAFRLRTQILDNRVVAVSDVAEDLSDVECLTIRNIVADATSSICDSAAILEGAWTVVIVDTCIGPNGLLRMRFSNALPRLKEEFARHDVCSSDIVAINLHPQGFHLRLAFDDLNSGIMDVKFLRSHCYKAVESLKNSVSAEQNLNANEKWTHFRKSLGVDRATLEHLVHQEERHGDYSKARPMSGAEVDSVLAAIAEVIGAYVSWFRREKLHESTGAV